MFVRHTDVVQRVQIFASESRTRFFTQFTKFLSLFFKLKLGVDYMETLGYDILKKDSVGAPIWLEAVRDLDTAKRRVSELAENSPGEYVVFCEQTSRIVDSFVLA